MVQNIGIACGPRYPLILHKALATWPVSATIANAGFTIINNKDLATPRKSWFRLYQRNQRNHSNQR